MGPTRQRKNHRQTPAPVKKGAKDVQNKQGEGRPEVIPPKKARVSVPHQESENSPSGTEGNNGDQRAQKKTAQVAEPWQEIEREREQRKDQELQTDDEEEGKHESGQ